LALVDPADCFGQVARAVWQSAAPAAWNKSKERDGV
jgi:hypothetical protein